MRMRPLRYIGSEAGPRSSVNKGRIGSHEVMGDDVICGTLMAWWELPRVGVIFIEHLMSFMICCCHCSASMAVLTGDHAENDEDFFLCSGVIAN